MDNFEDAEEVDLGFIDFTPITLRLANLVGLFQGIARSDQSAGA